MRFTFIAPLTYFNSQQWHRKKTQVLKYPSIRSVYRVPDKRIIKMI